MYNGTFNSYQGHDQNMQPLAMPRSKACNKCQQRENMKLAVRTIEASTKRMNAVMQKEAHTHPHSSPPSPNLTKQNYKCVHKE